MAPSAASTYFSNLPADSGLTLADSAAAAPGACHVNSFSQCGPSQVSSGVFTFPPSFPAFPPVFFPLRVCLASPVDGKQCPHCQKVIPDANYSMHELRCARNSDYHKVRRGRWVDVHRVGVTYLGGIIGCAARGLFSGGGVCVSALMYPCKSEFSPHPLLLQVACTTCGASLNKKELALHAHCGLCKEVLPQGPTGQKIHDAVRGCTACNDNAHIPMSGWPWLCLFRTLGYFVGVLLCLFFALITLAPRPLYNSPGCPPTSRVPGVSRAGCHL